MALPRKTEEMDLSHHRQNQDAEKVKVKFTQKYKLEFNDRD